MEETGASSSSTHGHSVSEPEEREAAGTQSYGDVHLEFNLETGDYTDFICKFRTKLAEHEDREVIRGGRPVLTKQDSPKTPRRWMYIKLVGEKDETTTLAIRDDNVYLIGFQGKNKRWYEFGFKRCKPNCFRHRNNAQCAAAPDSVPIMKKDPKPTFLGCDVEYSDLLQVYISESRKGQLRKAMVSLDLGKRSAIKAVGILSRYEQAEGGVVDPGTRVALVRLILMFCEATRMIPFFNTVLASWDDTAGPYCIREDQAIYIWNWGNMSAALKEWKIKHYKSWGPIKPTPGTKAQITQILAKDDIGIKSAADALGVVQLLLNKRDRVVVDQEKAAKNKATKNIKSKGHAEATGGKEKSRAGCNKQTPDHNVTSSAGASFQVAKIGFGRPLVEVFSVRADPAVVGTISVFDGKRGQVIYRHHASLIPGSPSQGKTDLALTGPFRTISAEGSFAIHVDDITSGADASDKDEKKVGGDMFWDCYSDDVVYDQVANQDVSIGNTGSIVNVTYAVLSDAVEATVQVHLKLFERDITAGATARIHGKITVHSELFGDNSVLLFSRVEEEEMEVEVESYGRCLAVIPVPLARSVIAAPLDLQLLLNVNLHAAYPPNSRNIVSIHERMYFPRLDQYTGEIESNGVAVQVTSPHIYPLVPSW